MNLTNQQRTALDGLVKVVVATLMLVLIIFIVTSCAKSPDIPQATAKVYTDAEVRGMMFNVACGDSAYAQVNSAWLKWYYEQFRAELFRQGVTKWDERMDCNHFASYYVALAQTKFYAANFHSWTKAQSLGVGVYWYYAPRGPHAIVFALTERGLLFIEPQTGAEVALSDSERRSVILQML